MLIADNIEGFLWWFRGGDLYEGPTRAGYQFDGWYLDSTFTTPVTAATTVPPTQFTLYARWDEINLPPTYLGYLHDAITEAESRDQQDYTAVSWANLQTQLTVARAVYQNQYATQQQVDTATESLLAAIEALELIEINVPPTYRGYLYAAIAVAESHNQQDYTAESWTNLQTQLAAARVAYQNQYVTQLQIDAATKSLLAAIEALESLGGYPGDPPTYAGLVTTAPWRLYANGTLVIESGGIRWNQYQSPWHTHRNDILNIVIDGPVYLGPSVRGLFASLPYLTTILGLNYLDLSGATNLNSMFRGAHNLAYIGDLSGWDVSNVTTMYSMFRDTHALTTIPGIGSWDTSSLRSMSRMFQDATAITNLDVSSWNTSNVTEMRHLFQNARNLEQLDLSGWQTGNVTWMNDMFHGASSLTSVGDLSEWDVSQVANMYSMFRGTSINSIPGTGSWNTGSLTVMARMFQDAVALTTLDVSGWDTRNVTDMRHVFQNAASLTQLDLTGWRTGNVTRMNDMFRNARNLSSIGDLSEWDVSQVTTMYSLFRDTNLSSIPGIGYWNLDSLTVMARMFQGLTSLTNIDVGSWGTRNVTDMRSVFQSTPNLTALDLSGWDTSNVTNMTSMLTGAGINQLTLGENFVFSNLPNGPGLRVAIWRNASGAYVFTSAELVMHHNAAPTLDTWVLE